MAGLKPCDKPGCANLAGYVIYSGELRKGYIRTLLCHEHCTEEARLRAELAARGERRHP